MRTILVVNAKGGCGKTTLSTNIVSYYATRGRKTVLVDFDVQQSSMDWLKQRPDWREAIVGLTPKNGPIRYPAGTEMVVIDSPARVQGRDLSDLVRRADLIIVPVLPSPIDIRAAAQFLGDLLMLGRIRGNEDRVAVVANRVKENTLVYIKLRRFLKSLKIPFIATIRDTQNYIRAADGGIGIFEMAPSMVRKDVDQWRSLLRWLNKKK